MERSRFDLGETQKFFNARFNREFENTLLDTFHPDNARRCVDAQGDSGWVVGSHKPIEVQRGTIDGWNWVIRDRDQALVGIHDELLRIDEKTYIHNLPPQKAKKKG